MSAVVVTTIEAGQWIATTPNANEPVGCGDTEAHAINALIASIRAYRDEYERHGRPVPWKTNTDKPIGGDVIVRELSGLAPPHTVEPESLHNSEDNKQLSQETNYVSD